MTEEEMAPVTYFWGWKLTKQKVRIEELVFPHLSRPSLPHLDGPVAVDASAKLCTGCGKVNGLLDGVTHGAREGRRHAKPAIVQDLHGNLGGRVNK